MDRDSNLIFGIVATQLFRVPPGAWFDAVVCWAADSEKDLAHYVCAKSVLAQKDCALIERIVREAVRGHDGDSSAALATFGGEAQVAHAFRGAICLTEGGGVEPASSGLFPWGQTDAVVAVEESAGRYGAPTEVGRGGMGKVLLVHDEHLGRDIALKELLPVTAPSGSSIQHRSFPHVVRFLQEARITGQLEHPSIVPVYELGHRKDGALYYTMKFVRGRTFGEAIKKAATLNERLDLLPHFVDLCQAVAYAHSRGVVHRDIKPVNVMVGEFGETVLLDWGLAKAKTEQDVHADGLSKTIQFISDGDEDGVAKSAYGDALGTPAYMAPEQAEGKLDLVDERSDIYSLGAVLYELLTGHAPFEGGNMFSTLWRVMNEEPRPIETLQPDVPPELAAICRRAMQRERDLRYDSAKAIAEELLRFESGALVHSYEYRFWELLGRFVRKHKGIIATAAIALCIVVAGGVFSYFRVLHQKRLAVEAYEKETEARLSEQRAREVAERESYSAGVLLAQKHAEDGAYDLAKQALWQSPQALRDWEWGYVLALCNQDLFTFGGHEDRIVDLATSPDSTRFATASWDKTGRVWDLRQGTSVATLEGHEDGLTSVTFSPDGSRVLTSSFDGTARVWDASSGAELLTLREHEGAVNRALYSSDGGRIITASQDKTAKVWDAQTGAVLATLGGNENNVGSACFSASGSQILTTSWRDHVVLWDAATYQQKGVVGGNDSRCFDAVFSPDESRVLVMFMDKGARVWHAKTGIGLYSLPGHTDRILHAEFSSDGVSFATASSDKTARVWDARNGASISELLGHSDMVEHVTFSPDGRTVLTASRDKTARLWDAMTGTPLAVLGGHGDSVIRAEFTRDGARAITASYDGTAKLWKPSGGAEETLRLPDAAVAVTSAEFNADGSRLLVLLADGTVAVWNLTTCAEAASFTSFSDFSRAAISPDGKRVVTVFSGPGFNSNVWVWDVDTHAIVAAFSEHLATVNDVAFSPDGTSVVTASDDGTARVWDASSGAEKTKFVGVSKTMYKAVFSADGKSVVTASSDDAARIWDIQTGGEVATFPNDKWLDSVALAPKGDRLLTTTEEASVIWDVAGRTKLVELDGQLSNTSRRPFNPSGTRVVAVTSGKAKVYGADTGNELFALPGVEYAAFCPDDVSLLTVGKDDVIRFLRAAPYREEMLPEDGANWQSRFDLYKQRHLADAERPRVATPAAFGLVVATREDAAVRLRQLARVFMPGFSPEWAPAIQEAATGPGLCITEGPVLAVLSRLCLRKEDRIVRVNGKDTPAAAECLAAFDAFLKEQDSGVGAELTLEVTRGGVARQIRFQFIEETRSEIAIAFPRSTLGLLLAAGLPFIETDAAVLEEQDHRQAKWHREPELEGKPVGFWIDETYHPFLDELLRQMGIRLGDRVISVNGRPIESSEGFIESLRMIDEARRAGTLASVTAELGRGLFHRVKLVIALE